MSRNQSGNARSGMGGSLLVVAVVGSLIGCAHPSKISYGRTMRGFHGLQSQISLETTRKCEFTRTELDRIPQRGMLTQEDCAALFANAARAKLVRAPNCPASEVFSAGVAVKLSNGTMLYGCADQPLASFMAQLSARVAPAESAALKQVP